jgi:hypothetical protein
MVLEDLMKIVTAMYSKGKDSLDKKVANEIRTWADQCSLNGMLSSGIFIKGVWEREEGRARTLCRYYWETAIELSLKQAGTLRSEDAEIVKTSARGIIEIELGQAMGTISDWIRRSMPSLHSHYEQRYKDAVNNFYLDLDRELEIRQGLAKIEKPKSTVTELPTSVIVDNEFSFVTDDELRKICKRDYEEVQRVQMAGAHKATIILSGSLTEALLLDTLQKDEVKVKASPKAPSKPLMQWDLHNLLEVAIDLDLINAGAGVLVKGIKDYRNLIHPGKEIRTKFHVGSEEAAISRQFLELVIRDLSGKAATE